jgi:TonB family protein
MSSLDLPLSALNARRVMPGVRSLSLSTVEYPLGGSEEKVRRSKLMSGIKYLPQSYHHLARAFICALVPSLVLCLVTWGAAQTPRKLPYGEDVLLLTLSRVAALPKSEIPVAMEALVQRVRRRGVGFKMNPVTEAEFRKAGASPALVATIGKAYRPGITAPAAGGVLNARAVSLPQPAYPAIARAARASGTVAVEIVVDESGKVIWAEALSGHPLLMKSAVEAARQAEFAPVKLKGQPVKVSGLITYNFILQ